MRASYFGWTPYLRAYLRKIYQPILKPNVKLFNGLDLYEECCAILSLLIVKKPILPTPYPPFIISNEDIHELIMELRIPTPEYLQSKINRLRQKISQQVLSKQWFTPEEAMEIMNESYVLYKESWKRSELFPYHISELFQNVSKDEFQCSNISENENQTIRTDMIRYELIREVYHDISILSDQFHTSKRTKDIVMILGKAFAIYSSGFDEAPSVPSKPKTKEPPRPNFWQRFVESVFDGPNRWTF